MKPGRLLALLAMVGVLVAIVAVPFMCIAALRNEADPFMAEVKTAIKDAVGHSASEGEIVISGPVEVVWSPGDSNKVEFTGPSEMVARARQNLEGGGVALWFEDGTPGSGVVTAKVSGPQPQRLRIMGSGKMSLSGLDTGPLDVEIEGSGDVKLVGKAKELDVTIEGSGGVDATGLSTQDAKIRTAGSGDTKLGKLDSLKVEIDGSGNVSYASATSVESNVNGSGRVAQR